jgi:hypothetical protein
MNAAVILLLQLPLCMADPEQAVDAGQRALDQSWWRAYPWYNPQTDGLRRVDVVEPWSCNPLADLGFGISGGLLRWLGWAILALLLAVAVYVLVRAYRDREARLAHGGRAEPPGGDGDADRIEALPFPVGRGRRDLLGQSRRSYQQGDYSQAIIYLFSFQLVELDKQQIIRLTKGKTNRQYLREVGPRSSLRRLVEQTMVAFEDVFFGNHALDRARFESCWARLSEFESLAAEGAR